MDYPTDSPAPKPRTSVARVVGYLLLGGAVALVIVGIDYLPKLHDIQDAVEKMQAAPKQITVTNPFDGQERTLPVDQEPLKRAESDLSSAEFKTVALFGGAALLTVVGIVCLIASKPRRSARRRSQRGRR